MRKPFYCYSRSLRLFLNSFGIDYIATSVNRNSNKQFWTFPKSDKLNKLIDLWQSLQHYNLKEEAYGQKAKHFKD